MSAFTPGLVAFMTPERRAAISHTLSHPGAVQSIVLVGRKTADGIRVYNYRIAYRNESYLFTWVIDKDNKISGIGLDLE
jgi:hypothetical protein